MAEGVQQFGNISLGSRGGTVSAQSATPYTSFDRFIYRSLVVL